MTERSERQEYAPTIDCECDSEGYTMRITPAYDPAVHKLVGRPRPAGVTIHGTTITLGQINGVKLQLNLIMFATRPKTRASTVRKEVVEL